MYQGCYDSIGRKDIEGKEPIYIEKAFVCKYGC